MKKFALFAFTILFLGCDFFGDFFVPASDETLSNNVNSLGLKGTSVSSSNSDIATARLTSSGKLRITSASQGVSIITVSDQANNCAYVRIGVLKDGSVTIKSIVKYSNDAQIPVIRDDLENDMFRAGEGKPSGVPDSYGWGLKPRVNYGNNIPDDWNAILAWGQVNADRDLTNPDKQFPLVRVHLKDIAIYIYRSDGTWELINSKMNPDGDLYDEKSTSNVHKPANPIEEKDGGISIQAGSGFFYHFWGARRTLTNKDIKGVFVVCKARLIGTENYDTPPKYLISIGGDYWRSMSAVWASGQTNNDDIGIGRFKYITPEWKYFTMHTFKQNELKNIKFPLE